MKNQNEDVETLGNLAPQAKKVAKLQRDAAIKAAWKAAKASTGMLTPARKAAKEKATLAKAVAQKLSTTGTNLTDLEILKIAGLESTEINGTKIGEEAQGAVTTGNLGVSTMSTGEGDKVPAAFGSSHIFAPKVGSMLTRKGDIKSKKKRRIREFTEYYFSESRTYKVEPEDLVDIEITVKELGLQSQISPDEYEQIAQEVYQKTGRWGIGSWKDDVVKRIVIQHAKSKKIYKPYKIDRGDLVDIEILVKELGLESKISPLEYEQIAQEVYQEVGRRGIGHWNPAARRIIIKHAKSKKI